jgi:hypothetical protein
LISFGLVLPKINFMTPEQKNTASWLDDLTDLIREKQDENLALRKVQESLISRGVAKDGTISPLPDEDQVQEDSEKDPS